MANELVFPFLIDVGHTGKERKMFVLGYELGVLWEKMLWTPFQIEQTVHIENEERIRLICHRRKRKCFFTKVDDNWLILVAEARPVPSDDNTK